MAGRRVLNEKPRWFRPRGYLHFDRPVPFSFAERHVQDPQAVRQHSFWPFITFKKTTPRYRRSERKVKPKDRPFGYAAHLDAHVYSWYAELLSRRLEEVLSREECGASVLAYRALGKSNVHFAAEAFEDIRETAPCTVIAFDISGFFDNLDHQLLKSAWCSLLDLDQLPPDHYNVFKSITRYASVDQPKLFREFGISPMGRRSKCERICSAAEFRTRVRAKRLIRMNPEGRGIPQGSPISAVLSNVYLLEFDRRMCALQAEVGGSYRRYSDDILWIVPPEVVATVTEKMEQETALVSLAINEEKTETCDFTSDEDGELLVDRPVQYLGLTFDGTRSAIRSSTLARYYRRMKTGVHHAKRAASRNVRDPRVYRRRLYERFTHLGHRNFVSYGRRAERITGSRTIRRQVGRHWRKLHKLLQE